MTTIVSAMLAYPNPFLSAVTVEITTEHDDEGVVRLTDTQGKIVKMLFWHFKKGMNITRFSNLDHLPNGQYFIDIVDLEGNVLHHTALAKEL